MEIEGRRVYIVTGAKTQTVNICTLDNERGTYDYVYRFERSRAIRPDEVDEDMSLAQFRDWLVGRGGWEERRPQGVSGASGLPRAVRPGEAAARRPDRREVFVVHGRDSQARDALFNFLRASTFGL